MTSGEIVSMFMEWKKSMIFRHEILLKSSLTK